MPFEQLDKSSYTTLCNTLIRQKGSKEQRNFLRALRKRDTFMEWFSNEVKVIKGDPLPILKTPLTESEYKEAPKDTEEQIFKDWQELKPADACKTSFWATVTFQHISRDIIKPSYLAANGGNLPSGLERIDWALKERQAKKIDSAVRTALRRFSGLHEARGHRSVYVDCPFARAWWRQYLANEVCENTNADKKKVLRVFRKTQGYWEKLILSIVSKNSSLGDSRVRNAIVWALSELVDNKQKADIFIVKTLERIINHIGIQSASLELAIFSVEELKEMIASKFIANV